MLVLIKKYVSMNETGQYVAIAGKRGLAHYSAISTKWKLFGNEHQEQTFIVRGGIVWWQNIIAFACQDLESFDHEANALSNTRFDSLIES